MADPETRDAPPATPEAKAEEMQKVNDEARHVPTRPGWRAGIAVLAFLGGFIVYMTYM